MGALLSLITTLSPTSSTPRLTTPGLEQKLSATVPKPDPNASPKSKGTEFHVADYWNANVPEDLKTKEIPEFLKGIPERHQRMLAVPADQYHVLEWKEVTELIDIGEPSRIPRGPVEHRRYFHFKYNTEKTYGDLEKFMEIQRLGWVDSTPKGAPFTNEDDIKIIYNDWPYGIDSRIKHLCVWTKFSLPNDESTGHLKSNVRQQVDDYIEKKFRSRVPADQVRWFKNLDVHKSIHKYEHIQLMLFDPDPGFMKEVTKDDYPRSLRIPADLHLAWQKEWNGQK